MKQLVTSALLLLCVIVAITAVTRRATHNPQEPTVLPRRPARYGTQHEHTQLSLLRVPAERGDFAPVT